MKNNSLKLFSVGILVAMLSGCGGELEKADYNISYNSDLLPKMQTGEVIMNCGNTAVTTIGVDNKSSIVISEQGLLYDTESSLSLVNAKIVRVGLEQDGSAKVIMANMTPGSVYYYRSYAYTDEGIAYGEIRKFTAASRQWDSEIIYATDFKSENCVNDFTAIKLAGDGKPWTVVKVPMENGLPDFVLASSSLDMPSLFNGKLVGTKDADNLLLYKADLKGKVLPMISVWGIDVDGYLVKAGRNSSMEILVSSIPITSAEEADAAESLGTISFSGKEYSLKKDFLLPAKYSNTQCYIAIRNKAVFANSLGALLGDFRITSFVEPGK